MANKKKKSSEYNDEVGVKDISVETAEEVTVEEEESTPTPKMPPNMEEIKPNLWRKYVITMMVLLTLVLVVAWIQGAYSQVTADMLELYHCNERQFRFMQWSNAFASPGILTICMGLLVVASNGGAFDMLAYGISSVFRLFRKDPIDRKYGNFYEYRKAKQAKKRSFWYLVIVGAAFALISALLLIGYYVE